MAPRRKMGQLSQRGGDGVFFTYKFILWVGWMVWRKFGVTVRGVDGYPRFGIERYKKLKEEKNMGQILKHHPQLGPYLYDNPPHHTNLFTTRIPIAMSTKVLFRTPSLLPRSNG